MTNRFYLISSLIEGTPAALVEAPSPQRALIAHAGRSHWVKPANARDVASAFQTKLLIISAPDVTPTDEKNEQT